MISTKTLLSCHSARLCLCQSSSMQLTLPKGKICQLKPGRYRRDRGINETLLRTVTSCKNKSRKQKSRKRTDVTTTWEEDDSGWVGKTPVQATTKCAHAFTRSHMEMEVISLALFSRFLSNTNTHYLLVKPRPELGEETKRHWEDYYRKGRGSGHHMYQCDMKPTGVRAVRGQTLAGRRCRLAFQHGWKSGLQEWKNCSPLLKRCQQWDRTCPSK